MQMVWLTMKCAVIPCAHHGLVCAVHDYDAAGASSCAGPARLVTVWARNGVAAARRPRFELEPESLLLIAVNGQHATYYKGRLH